MLSIGRMTIQRINDCNVLVDAGGPFGLVPRSLWKHYFTPDDNNLIPMCQNCLLVQVDGKNIVVDTGLGTKLNERQRGIWHLSRPDGGLVEGLARLSVTPEQVDLVIDTHLHADHCGGNTRLAEDGTTVIPTFPNAEYVVQRREYEDAMRPNERTRATYLPENFEPLLKSGQMRLLDGDTELLPGVRGVITPGHTPGHMSVVFEDGGQTAAFVCDLASYAVHFERLGWMTAYDVEPLITLETKRRWQTWALEHDAALIFPHDSLRPVGKLRIDEAGKPRVDVVE